MIQQDQLPFGFPTNFQQFTNGTMLPPDPSQFYIIEELINTVWGVIDESTYQNLVRSIRTFGTQVGRSMIPCLIST
jgi:hypothetical protein